MPGRWHSEVTRKLMFRSWSRPAAEILLRPFAQIFFSRDLGTGALLLLAMGMFPRLLLTATLTVVVTAGLVRALGLGSQVAREGLHGCVALMVVLTVSAFTPENLPLPLLIGMASLLAVVLTAAWESLMGLFYLPPHSFPSALAAWIVLLAVRYLPLPPASALLSAPLAPLPSGMFDSSWWDLPASLIYLRGWLPGVLVMLALVLHSRIAVVLAGLGMLVAAGVRLALPGAALSPSVETLASINAAYTAMALGGLWFIPQPSSVALAMMGATLSCILTYALANVLSLFYLPVLGLPFALATHLVLLTARRRERDASPQSTLPGERPEQALARYMMGTVRWASAAPWIAFRLPFRGPWVVTQGNDGAHTHKGPWRHGFDFEVKVAQATSDGTGAELRDYHCYGRPVLAAGAGEVALVVDGIPDNRPGSMNTEQSWGNAVVLKHGPTLFTVYAHLQPRSIRVSMGEHIQLGAEIARCGNSGRSATPHLHFQAQKAAALGSPTLPISFADVVRFASNQKVPEIIARTVPDQDDELRTLVWDDALAQALSFHPGSTWHLSDPDKTSLEVVSVQIDLFGRTVLRSPRAHLLFALTTSGLTAADFGGDRRSLLRPIFVALARLPFDHAASAVWEDHLPMGPLVSPWLGPLSDLGTMFFPKQARLRVKYSLSRDADSVTVRGVSRLSISRARLSLDGDRHEFEVEQEGHVRRVILERDRGEAKARAA